LAKSGNWWLPDRQEKQFYGELSFNQSDGGTLILSDTLDKLYDFPTRNEDFIILGNFTEELKNDTKSFTKVAAVISLMTSQQEKIGQIENSVKIVLRLKYIFLGIHIEDKNIKFEKIAVSYSNLDHWISAIHDLDAERLQDRTTYNSPVIAVNDECIIQINSSPTFHREDSKTIREDNIQFAIESLGDKTFRNYLELEGKVRDFLNFAITKAIVIQSFEGFIGHGHASTPARILIHTYITEKMHKLEIKSRSLFLYSEVADRLEYYLNNWFRLYRENKVIMDLFFGVVYNTKSYLSNNFLMLFTAIEAYHQAFIDEHSERKKEKELFGDNVIKKIEEYGFSKEERERLKQLVNVFGKQLSSKERLEEIYDQYADILPSLSSKIGTKNNFIRRIVDIRNDLSHGNVHPDSLDKDNDLFWQFKNLQLILQLCILSRLGFDNEKIKQIYYLDKITNTRKSLS